MMYSIGALGKTLVSQAVADGVQRIVVGAVIIEKGCVLLLRRKRDDFLGSLWELPSGKLAAGETVREGIVREVHEETGRAVTEVVGFINGFDYLSKSGKRTRQLNFFVRTDDAPITLQEHDAHRWTPRADLPGAKATTETLSAIRRCFDMAGNRRWDGFRP